MGFKITGLDEIQKRFEQMEHGAEELEQTKEIPFSDLFTPQFMRKHTSFSSFDELLLAGNFHVESKEDFEKIPDDIFDIHISKTTKFSNWNDMLEKATEIYVGNKLGFN